MWAAGVCVLTMLAPAPTAALAQDGDPAPSAEELWREYPLEATPEVRPRRTAQPTSSAPAVGARPSGESGGAGTVLLIAAGIAAAGAAGAAGAALARARRREKAAPAGATLLPGPGVRVLRPSAPDAAAAVRSDRPRPLVLGAPTDRALDWRAEIEWRHARDGSRFRITASTPASSERIAVGESQLLAWPPTGPDAVQALRRAVDELQSAAVAAGWRPVQAGPAWYAKRFVWQGVGSPPGPGEARAGTEIVGGER
jgi:hypothetical protein